MKKIIFKIINFIKKSIPQPLLSFLLLSLLISVFWTILTANNEKINTESNILEKEKITAEWNKQETIQKEECYKKCDEEKTKYSQFGFCKIDCDIESNIIRYDPELQKLKNIQETPLITLWIEEYLPSNPFFYIPVLLLLIIPLIRLLIIFIKSLKYFLPKAKKQINEMSVFQKYLMVLIFCILLVLIFILIKLF